MSEDHRELLKGFELGRDILGLCVEAAWDEKKCRQETRKAADGREDAGTIVGVEEGEH